VYQQISYN